jgi:hypothetical protein
LALLNRVYRHAALSIGLASIATCAHAMSVATNATSFGTNSDYVIHLDGVEGVSLDLTVSKVNASFVSLDYMPDADLAAGAGWLTHGDYGHLKLGSSSRLHLSTTSVLPVNAPTAHLEPPRFMSLGLGLIGMACVTRRTLG